MDNNDELLGRLAESMNRRQVELSQRLSGRRGRSGRARPQGTSPQADDNWLTEILAVETNDDATELAAPAPPGRSGEDHRATAQGVIAAAQRLGQLAASLESEPAEAVPVESRAWLAEVGEQLDRLLVHRPQAPSA